MENLFLPKFSWTDLLFVTIFLVAFYFLLKFLEDMLSKFSFFGKYHTDVHTFVHHTLLIFEPLFILILGSIFVLINPVFHGILVGIILMSGFFHIRNYFSGRIIQFGKSIAVGKRIKTKETQGIISKMGRLGLNIRTNKGLQFLNYSKLAADGYTLLSGEEIGGFYQLQIQPVDAEEKKNYATQLLDLLTTTPYLDWNHTPQIIPNKDPEKPTKVRVVVKEESHLHDLITLIQEWGFTCKVVS